MNNQPNKNQEQMARLMTAVSRLPESQIATIEQIVDQFGQPQQYWVKPDSDLVSTAALDAFGDVLQLHHCFSEEPFSKDKFEYALVRVANLCGARAEKAPRGNPGHDVTIDGHRFSLKTQANASIREDSIWISKFMELGRGEWEFDQLRRQFFHHLERYDRIITLRCLDSQPTSLWYELVEIPKTLLLESATGAIRVDDDSRQTPKPGYCDVFTDSGLKKFCLYFDGGTERKLQIKDLQKQFCTVHATWRFSVAC